MELTPIIDNNNNITLLNNVIIMDIEELHPAWTTYGIDVIPSQPRPLKLVICVKAKEKCCEDNQNKKNDKQEADKKNDEHKSRSEASPGVASPGLDPDVTMVKEPATGHNTGSPAAAITKEPIASLRSATSTVLEPIAKSGTAKALYATKPVKILHVLPRHELFDSNGHLIRNTSSTAPPIIAYQTPPADAAFTAAISKAEGKST
ncbi:hypothetical protein PAXINDRAFT_14441 [Paxillus involutus ATCC 200175]|uniref:Uncharacterized protein n=1 Tax=Paxillus involutus ATCC 200175 TaxID=664439 RepID=A0A0C9SUG6_PAXIN|nr:hypothetical protein PAXINDRAFT_14441 [Paxillus involutus ATCC 200175]